MRPSMMVAVVAVGLAAGSACTGPGRATTVEGVTQYRVCGGVQPEPGMDPCQPPIPVAARVTLWRGEQVVTTVRSGASGRFSVSLPRGTYTAQAALTDPEAPFVDCPQVEIEVPASDPVILTCSLLAP
jgi:hypothetical protein